MDASPLRISPRPAAGTASQHFTYKLPIGAMDKSHLEWQEFRYEQPLLLNATAKPSAESGCQL
eukprot:6196297-Pleurochrysis_carterae.AAC.2